MSLFLPPSRNNPIQNLSDWLDRMVTLEFEIIRLPDQRFPHFRVGLRFQR